MAIDEATAVIEKGDKSVDAAAPEDVVARARAELTRVLELLGNLVTIHPTVERESLRGSTWKLLARLERLAGHEQAERTAIEKAEAHYRAVEELVAPTDPSWFYPARNRMVTELFLRAAEPTWAGFSTERVVAVRRSLETKHYDDPDFWMAAGLIELKLYDALASRRLAKAQPPLADEFEKLHETVPVPRLWESVKDQLWFVFPALVEGSDRNTAASLLEKLAAYSRVAVQAP